MDLTQIIEHRRSIRKYQDKQIEKSQLEDIISAGIHAPNAGGGQRTYVVGIHNKELVEIVGKLNLSGFDRSKLIGSYVSKEQPSVIDDPTIKSGFYGAPTVCAIFAPKNFLYSIPDAFCVAENMVLKATELGLASCIVARGEETFEGEYGQSLLRQWGVPEKYIARCFVLLGYCEGKYPDPKPIKGKRTFIVE
jgi:nitroreductase